MDRRPLRLRVRDHEDGDPSQGQDASVSFGVCMGDVSIRDALDVCAGFGEDFGEAFGDNSIDCMFFMVLVMDNVLGDCGAGAKEACFARAGPSLNLA
mmetsp:Transcript_48226/g.103392  ORF Transcript_48226/g.103392 Transcript_48226/m.103392 type:complete len:97 (-) Transcript_48226:644-934(-)